MSWYTYILQCRDNSFYTGITNSLQKRLFLHNSKKGSKALMSKLPVTLVYFETYSNKSLARKREIQLKGWTHFKKQFLIEGKLF